MNVKAKWLIYPIVLVIVLLFSAYVLLSNSKVEKVTYGYQYKDKLFLEDEVGVIEVAVTDENWQKILQNPTAEQYVEASVTVNGETYHNVGVRAKGNSSLTSVANSESERYSLKIDFSQYNSSQTYYGLEKINLNNNFSDTTQMKEFVSYELMEQLGIATPAHSYVKVLVNGEYYGLMLAVEEIGAAFAVTNYGSTEGFIFKPEDAGSDLKYTDDETESYSGIFASLKMNKQTAEKQSNIINMMKEISVGNTASLNVEQIANYFALNTAMVNMDSYQGMFKHNYYLYENGNGQFEIIPWDYNMSFGGFTGMGGQGGNMERPANGNRAQNNERPAMNEAGPGIMNGSTMMTDTNIHFSITEPVSGTTVDERPLLKIILEDEEANQYYRQALTKISEEILTEQNILAITAPLAELLLPYVEEDPSKFGTTEQFLVGASGDESIAAFAKARSESIVKQLAGEIEGVTAASSGGFNFPNMGQGQMPPGMNSAETNGEDEEGMPNISPGQAPPNMGQGQMPPGMNSAETNGEVGTGMPNISPGQAPPNMGQGQMPPGMNSGETNGEDGTDMPNISPGQAPPNMGQGQMPPGMNGQEENSDSTTGGIPNINQGQAPPNMGEGMPPGMNNSMAQTTAVDEEATLKRKALITAICIVTIGFITMLITHFSRRKYRH